MATRFEISQQSLIKKYEKLNDYFKKWNVSEIYVETHSDPQHLRANLVKASWGNEYGNDESGLTKIETRIEELKQAKTMDDLQKFREEIGTGSVKSFLRYNSQQTNKEAWNQSILDKFSAIYQGLNKSYSLSKINEIYDEIKKLRKKVENLDELSITYKERNELIDYLQMYYEENVKGDKIAAKEDLLKIAKIVYNQKDYKNFEKLIDNTL